MTLELQQQRQLLKKILSYISIGHCDEEPEHRPVYILEVWLLRQINPVG
jgi:hypothetical protein